MPIVDLFSGPGGLAEGFAAFRSPKGRRRFHIALSIEKDRDAHHTLRLRAFLRKFGRSFPSKYYDFLNGVFTEEPDWATLYPKAWAAACEETKCMELGTYSERAFLRRRIAGIREEHGGRTVLLGGPPCQSYSVIGRSRNVGNDNYKADEDDRQSLYEHYAQVLDQLRPAVAVMENVRGLLSARWKGDLVFPQVMHRLRHAGGMNGYKLYALDSRSGATSWDEGLTPNDFLVQAEEHGVPQTRHRVFVICVRSDLAATLPDEYLPRLEPGDGRVSVKDIIGAMPNLRSRLSQGDDRSSWQDAVRAACDLVDANQPIMSRDEKKRFQNSLALARSKTIGFAPPWCDARGKVSLPRGCPPELRDWIFDEKIERLPNNETRAHMAADLARYLFAAVFACTFLRSPKSYDFPEALAPNHANWETGKFDDRYRVQVADGPCTTVTSHIAKDGHFFIHPDPRQCRSLTVREVARLQTFPDNYFFHGSRSKQYIQVGNAVPPYLAYQIARTLWDVLDHHDRIRRHPRSRLSRSADRSAQSARGSCHFLSHSGREAPGCSAWASASPAGTAPCKTTQWTFFPSEGSRAKALVRPTASGTARYVVRSPRRRPKA